MKKLFGLSLYSFWISLKGRFVIFLGIIKRDLDHGIASCLSVCEQIKEFKTSSLVKSVFNAH